MTIPTQRGDVDILLEEEDELAEGFAAGQALVLGGPQIPETLLPINVPREITDATLPLDMGDETAVYQRATDLHEIAKKLAYQHNQIFGWMVSVLGFIDTNRFYPYIAHVTGEDIGDITSYAHVIGVDAHLAETAVKGYRHVEPYLRHIGFDEEQIEEIFNHERLNPNVLGEIQKVAQRFERETRGYQDEIPDERRDQAAEWTENFVNGAETKPFPSFVESQHTSDIKRATFAHHITEIGKGADGKAYVFGTFAVSLADLEAIQARKFDITFLEGSAELPVSMVIERVNAKNAQLLRRVQR